MLDKLARIVEGKSGRSSSWDTTGRNNDFCVIKPGQTKVIADIRGPGAIKHIWLTQGAHYRQVLIKITWDNSPFPSVLCPLGDFFCLGHEIVNSFESMLFTASTKQNNLFNRGCALNCYAPMPFAKRAKVELINESTEEHRQYYYVDYETYDRPLAEDMGYFHAEFRRENPFGGWWHDVAINAPEADIVNVGRQAWNDNYVIMETKGQGHYIGCNISVTNFHGSWWGEGDDMIWVDGYKWPPDLHGTGSEDYLNQAWGMQRNAFLRNGSSIHEDDTQGYQTSYVFHLENPVRFNRQIKVTIEHGHGNHLANEMSSVAYWYAARPTKVKNPPPVAKRMPVMRNPLTRKWIFDPKNQITSRKVKLNAEMRRAKARSKKKKAK